MKILTTAATYVPDLSGPLFVEAYTIVETETDTARAVVAGGRALYVDKRDDPSKTKQLTADQSLLDQVVAAQAAKAAAETKLPKA